MIEILYILLIILAILAVSTANLRNAIIYLGIFSFLCSFCYLLLKAPDVAIAEAVIGCTLATVLYLVAMKKYRLLRVYFCDESQKYSGIEKYELITPFTSYCKEHEIQLDIIDSHKNTKFILENTNYDLIVEEDTKGTINIYGDSSNYAVDLLITSIKKEGRNHVHFVNISKNNQGGIQ